MRTAAPFEIGIVVDDIDAVLPFYTELLGLAVLSDLSVPAAISRPAGLAPEGYRVVRLETDRGDRLKLARSMARPQATSAATHPMDRVGASYVTFIVDELKSLYERLVSARVAIRSEGIVKLRPGVSMVLATDPAGNWLEFVQYDDIASYRPKEARR